MSHEHVPQPPLGAKPRYLADEQRRDELGGAIYRYLQARTIIPPEWLQEWNEIVHWLAERDRQAMAQSFHEIRQSEPCGVPGCVICNA